MNILQDLIPKAKFHYGQEVLVKCAETNDEFLAVVSGIRIDNGKLDYTVTDEDGWMADGYTEEWLALPLGTRVRFLKTLDSGPDEYGPGNHYATKGDLGTVVEGQFPCKEGHWVTWDGWTQAPFGAEVGVDFEVVEEEGGK